MSKKVVGYIKLEIQAGKATPAPPVGPALGQKGLNIMEFCKAFNAQTQAMEAAPIPVVITAYADRTFTFILRKPPVSFMLQKAAGISKGSSSPGKGVVAGKVSLAQIQEIAQEKMCDMNAYTIEAAMRMVEGVARSSGIEVEKR